MTFWRENQKHGACKTRYTFLVYLAARARKSLLEYRAGLALCLDVSNPLLVAQVTSRTARVILIDSARSGRISFEAPTPDGVAACPLEAIQCVAVLNANSDTPHTPFSQTEFYAGALPHVLELVLLSQSNTAFYSVGPDFPMR